VVEHRYPERTVAPPPGPPITVGVRVPHAVLRPLLDGAEVTGAARDRLSAMMERFYRVPFGKRSEPR
jgi:hypothetical protein